MKNLQQYLRDADPMRSEPSLSQTEIEHMRRVVLASAREVTPVHVPWFALAATVLAVVAGVFVTRTPSVQLARTGPTPITDDEVRSATRQLQFATPGGTRVIWMFNPDFDVR